MIQYFKTGVQSRVSSSRSSCPLQPRPSPDVENMSALAGDRIQFTIDGQEVLLTWDELAGHVAATTGLHNNINTAWLTMVFVQIFLVHLGMLMLEIGSVSAKNTKSMIIKNIGNSGIAAICFYLLGYGIGFGSTGDEFVGWGDFATRGDKFHSNVTANTLYNGYSYADFLYKFGLMSLTPAIVSGSLSERTNVVAYFISTFFISLFTSPVIMHWAWSDEGWASNKNGNLVDTGVIDFAGSTVIHVAGGCMALVGAWIVGPRKGRFDGDERNLRMPRRNVTFSVLGSIFIWVGFQSINMGGLMKITGTHGDALGKIALNTTICAASAAVMISVMTASYERMLEPYSLVNGLTAGLCASSAGCATMTPEASLVTGLLAGAMYYGLSSTLCKVKIDDVVDVVSIHLGGGMVGSIMAGLFSNPDYYKIAIADKGLLTPCGALYKCEGLGVKQLAANVAFLFAVILWSTGSALIIFLPLRIMGLMRVDKLTEQAGLDFMQFEGNAYKIDVKSSLIRVAADKATKVRKNTARSLSNTSQMSQQSMGSEKGGRDTPRTTSSGKDTLRRKDLRVDFDTSAGEPQPLDVEAVQMKLRKLNSSGSIKSCRSRQNSNDGTASPTKLI